MKRVHAQGLTALNRSGQNRDRTDFLPPQASNWPTSVRLVILDPVGVETHSRVTRAARRRSAQKRADGADQRVFRSVEQRFVAHCATPSQGRPSSLDRLPRLRADFAVVERNDGTTHPRQCAARPEEASSLDSPDVHFTRGPFGKLHVRFGKGAHTSGPRPRRLPAEKAPGPGPAAGQPAAPGSARSRRLGRAATLPGPPRPATDNPHVIVTKGTKAGRGPASTAYLSHVLDGCGLSPRMIRSTRLVDLVNTMDPKLVAAAFGMDPKRH